MIDPKDLTEEIAQARRNLRVAAGESIAEEEQESLRREQAIKAQEGFLLRTIGLTRILLLMTHTVWLNDRPVTTWTVEGITFHLRRVGDSYVLSVGERNLLLLTPKDPNFGDRVFVAIGDELDRSANHA
jgi:hypothetical protein